MFIFEGNVVTITLTIAIIGTVAMRAVDQTNQQRHPIVRHLLRTLVLAIVCVVVIVVFGTKVGTIAHAIEQLKEGTSPFEAYPMNVGEVPF